MRQIRDDKILFFVTSPRSPFKMMPDIQLLVENLTNKPWNSTTQTQFGKLLRQSSDFLGEAKNDEAFSARDRINRAPKALGLVDLEPVIKLTDAGNLFINSSRPHEIFTRQLLKFQLPSEFHGGNYNIKPFLEILRLVDDLEKLSKDEIKMFALQMTGYDKYQDIKDKILQYRSKLKNRDKSKMSARTFRDNEFTEEVKLIYKDELSSITSPNKIKDFINKKKSNMRDYADACFRYLRASELVTVDRSTSYLLVPTSKKKEVEYILNNIDRNPKTFNTEKEFKDYLFNPTIPSLAIDNKEDLLSIITSLGAKKEDFINKSILELQDIQEKLINEHKSEKVKETIAELKTFSNYDEIIDMFDDIRAKRVVDQPLMLEWNVWRAFAMLNDGEITGNFKTDTEGMPLNTALGNKPDIECKYTDFDIIVEVTMSSGSKQYEMEGEPVARHLGRLKNEENRDINRGAYCIFIAPTINEATLAHFYALQNINIKFYGGKSKIIPLSLEDFLNVLSHAKKNQDKLNSSKLKNFIDIICKKSLSSQDEEEWYNFTKKSAKEWLLI